tara:strand:+ start:1973 stop:2332 length:360 start_codon:yes stop_codon:yes gene_type:complete
MIQVTNNPEEQFIVMKLNGYSTTSTEKYVQVRFTCQYSGYVTEFTSKPTITNERYTKFPITTVVDADFIEGLYLVKLYDEDIVYADNVLAFVRDQVPFSESEYVDYDDNDGSAYNVYVK